MAGPEQPCLFTENVYSDVLYPGEGWVLLKLMGYAALIMVLGIVTFILYIQVF
jgi:hypothetical protein